MWNLKYDANEPIYKTETDSQRTDLWLPREAARGMDWEAGACRCKPFHTEWMSTQVLLDSTGALFNICDKA